MKFTLGVVIALLIITFSIGDVKKNNISKYVRIKRQEGYVYKRPSVAFELPTRPPTPTPVLSQSFGKTSQAQQMYYAYSAPAEGSVNIGNSISGSTSTSSSGGYSSGRFASGTTSSGYSTTMQSSSGAGYNYESPTIGTQTTTPGTVPTTVGTAASSRTVESKVTGYNYGTTTAITTPNVAQTVSELASTKAPKYLPPLSIDESTVNIGGRGASPIGISPNVSSAPPTSTQGSTVAILSDSYLAPASMQPGSSTTLGSPSTAYLSPTASSTSSSYDTPRTPESRSPSLSQQTPTAAYLPPIASQGPTQGTVSTPAVTYLPPVLK